MLKTTHKLGVLIALLTALTVGCGTSTPHPVVVTARSAANTAALVYETSEATALLLYRAEQEAIVSQAEREGWTRDRAQQAITGVRTWWGVVWQAFHTARAAHDALASAIETAEAAQAAGRDPDLRSIAELSTRALEAERRIAKLLSEAKLRSTK